jgi:hypothetical protein
MNSVFCEICNSPIYVKSSVSTYKGTRSLVILRFGSSFAIWQWSSPDFLAKISDVDIQQFLWNAHYYFPVSLLWADNLLQHSSSCHSQYPSW